MNLAAAAAVAGLLLGAQAAPQKSIRVIWSQQGRDSRGLPATQSFIALPNGQTNFTTPAREGRCGKDGGTFGTELSQAELESLLEAANDAIVEQRNFLRTQSSSQPHRDITQRITAQVDQTANSTQMVQAGPKLDRFDDLRFNFLSRMKPIAAVAFSVTALSENKVKVQFSLLGPGPFPLYVPGSAREAFQAGDREVVYETPVPEETIQLTPRKPTVAFVLKLGKGTAREVLYNNLYVLHHGAGSPAAGRAEVQPVALCGKW
ncbi:MAG: hypothetical protein HY074_18295 [Deltaproteobacteria bacterium]|nr:hypothetical protein [Deltaproteobacteria bacterium]